MANEVITTLLENACPSIQYGTRTELLGESCNDDTNWLQGQLLQENEVQQVMGCQGFDGWKCSSFHGRPLSS